MLFRILLLFIFVPVALTIHQSHLNVRQKIDIKLNANQEFNLMPPLFLQTMTFGNDAFVADLLWLQLIQYYGASHLQAVEPEHLYRYFDTITTLDPDFETAYVFSSYLLSDNKKMTDQALKILAKGAENIPNSWKILFQQGMIYYLQEKNPVKAADFFAQAAKKPDAPTYLAELAAQLYRREDSIQRCELSFKLWMDNYEKTPTKDLKERAQRRLIETRIQCDLLILRKALNDYVKLRDQRWQKELEEAKKQKRRMVRQIPPPATPATLQNLVQAGILAQVPLDPFKRPYIYRQAGLQVLSQPLPWPPIDLKSSDFSN